MAAMMGCSLGLMRHAQKARTFTKNLTRVLLDAMHHELLAWGGEGGHPAPGGDEPACWRSTSLLVS